MSEVEIVNKFKNKADFIKKKEDKIEEANKWESNNYGEEMKDKKETAKTITEDYKPTFSIKKKYLPTIGNKTVGDSCKLLLEVEINKIYRDSILTEIEKPETEYMFEIKKITNYGSKRV